MKVLVISGHPDLEDSIANKTILEQLEKEPEIEISYLDKLYPDYKIDVLKEQEKLLKSDIIVFQYPMFWYSMPSLLQVWLEKVFEYGFSHGTDDNKLKGKKLIVSFTTGASKEAYPNINDYLNQIKATASLCGMEFIDYICTYGVSYIYRTEPLKINEMKLISKNHVEKLIELIKSI